MDEDGGGFRRTRYRGVERTGLAGYFVATAYNLVRWLTWCRVRGLGPFSRCDLPGCPARSRDLPGCQGRRSRLWTIVAGPL